MVPESLEQVPAGYISDDEVTRGSGMLGSVIEISSEPCSTPERGGTDVEGENEYHGSSDMECDSPFFIRTYALSPTQSCCSECCELHEDCTCNEVNLSDLGITYNPNFTQEELEAMESVALGEESMDPDLISDREGEEVLKERELADSRDGNFYMYNGERDVRNQFLLKAEARQDTGEGSMAMCTHILDSSSDDMEFERVHGDPKARCRRCLGY